jgi:hypothetical protein
MPPPSGDALFQHASSSIELSEVVMEVHHNPLVQSNQIAKDTNGVKTKALRHPLPPTPATTAPLDSENLRISRFIAAGLLHLQLLHTIIAANATVKSIRNSNDDQVGFVFKEEHLPYALSEALVNTNLLAGTFVLMHRPLAPWGIIETLSALCMVLGKGIVAASPYNPLVVAKVSIICQAATYGMGAVLFYRRRRTIQKSWTAAQVKNYVFSTLPAAFFGALTTVLFLFGETASCWTAAFETAATDSTSPSTELDRCSNIELSNNAFSLVFVTYAVIKVVILPFKEDHYTTHDVVRFNFKFVEQMQIISYGFAAFIGVYLFASSNEIDDLDTWVNTTFSSFVLNSLYYRQALAWILKCFLGVIVATAASFKSRSAKERDHNNPSRWGFLRHRIRAYLSTRASAAMSPMLRATFVMFSAISFFPSITLLDLSLTDDQSDLPLRFISPNSFAIVFHAVMASLYAMSTPKGSNTSENLFLSTLILNGVLSVAAGFFGTNLPEEFLPDRILLLLGTVLLIPGILTFRAYLRLHSDAQIDNHFGKAVGAIGAMFGPALFLYAEVVGCSTSALDPRDCYLLAEANWTVAFHLEMSALFFVCTDFAHTHLSFEDLITVNCDFATMVRLATNGLCWVCALFVFGTRPRDVVEGNYADPAVYMYRNFVVALKYFIAFTWICHLVISVVDFRHKIHVDHVHSGELEISDKDWSTRCWKGVETRLNKMMGFLRSPPSNVAVSPVFSALCLAVTWLAAAPIFLALIVAFVDKDNALVIGLLHYTGNVSFYVAMGYAVFYVFTNLQDDGDVNGARRKWPYWKTHVYIPALIKLSDLALIWMHFGYFSYLQLSFAVLCVIAAIVTTNQRLWIVDSADRQERWKHIHTVAVPIGIQLAAPLVFMTSEVLSCQLMAFLRCSVDPEDVPEDLPDEFRCDPTFGLAAENVCDGIMNGSGSILFVLLCISVSVVIFPRHHVPLTVEKICRINVSKWESFQLFLMFTVSMAALLAYSIREEKKNLRSSFSDDLRLFVIFATFILFVSNTFNQYRVQRDERADVDRTDYSSWMNGKFFFGDDDGGDGIEATTDESRRSSSCRQTRSGTDESISLGSFGMLVEGKRSSAGRSQRSSLGKTVRSTTAAIKEVLPGGAPGVAKESTTATSRAGSVVEERRPISFERMDSFNSRKKAASLSRQDSFQSRQKTGTKKSVWDGGTKGVAGAVRDNTSRLKKPEERGIRYERENRAGDSITSDASEIGEDGADNLFALNPGLI